MSWLLLTRPGHDPAGRVGGGVSRRSGALSCSAPSKDLGWIPADDLDELNTNIVGTIAVVAEYR